MTASSLDRRVALITGVTGQDGAYLAIVAWSARRWCDGWRAKTSRC